MTREEMKRMLNIDVDSIQFYHDSGLLSDEEFKKIEDVRKEVMEKEFDEPENTFEIEDDIER